VWCVTWCGVLSFFVPWCLSRTLSSCSLSPRPSHPRTQMGLSHRTVHVQQERAGPPPVLMAPPLMGRGVHLMTSCPLLARTVSQVIQAGQLGAVIGVQTPGGCQDSTGWTIVELSDKHACLSPVSSFRTCRCHLRCPLGHLRSHSVLGTENPLVTGHLLTALG
jgi:hypothetical protein